MGSNAERRVFDFNRVTCVFKGCDAGSFVERRVIAEIGFARFAYGSFGIVAAHRKPVGIEITCGGIDGHIVEIVLINRKSSDVVVDVFFAVVVYGVGFSGFARGSRFEFFGVFVLSENHVVKVSGTFAPVRGVVSAVAEAET